MKCPYKENLDCPFVDTAVMDKTTTCIECEYYHEGGNDFIDEIDDWNEFMMGL